VSWDIFAMDFPAEFKSVSDIPSDFKGGSLGSRSSIISKIKALIPSANFADPSWGLIDGEGWSIEVSIGDEDCDCIAFHVRGGEEAVEAVTKILEHLNIRAFDAQTGEFFVAGPTSLESFRKWRNYRDQAVGDP
jgi:hypothetical protein